MVHGSILAMGDAISWKGTELLRNIQPGAKTRNGNRHRCRTDSISKALLYIGLYIHREQKRLMQQACAIIAIPIASNMQCGAPHIYTWFMDHMHFSYTCMHLWLHPYVV